MENVEQFPFNDLDIEGGEDMGMVHHVGMSIIQSLLKDKPWITTFHQPEEIINQAYQMAEKHQLSLRDAIQRYCHRIDQDIFNRLDIAVKKACRFIISKDYIFGQYLKKMDGYKNLIGDVWSTMTNEKLDMKKAINKVIYASRQEARRYNRQRTMNADADAGMSGFIDNFEHQLAKDCPAIFEWTEEKSKLYFG